MDRIQQLSRHELEGIVRAIREALWLTSDGWNLQKEWDSSTAAAIADILSRSGLDCLAKCREDLRFRVQTAIEDTIVAGLSPEAVDEVLSTLFKQE